jgi:arsenite methyltransferase
MKIPTLQTPRLSLRPFHDGDAASLYPLMADPETIRHFPFKQAPSAEQVERMVAGQLRHWERHGHGWWAIELREPVEFIGWCGLQFLSETEEIEIGYLISKAHWGKGLATEAASAALGYAFGPLDLDALVGIVHPDNAGSRRVLEKLGGDSPVRDCYFEMDCFRYVVRRESFAASSCAENLPARPTVAEPPALTGLKEAYERNSREAQHGKALLAVDTLADALGARLAEAQYTAARLNAMMGRREKTYECLDHAVAAGWWDVARLQEDAAFAHLRHEEAFKALMRLAWARGYIWMLERDDRDSFQKPDDVMAALGFRLGERVAEIGPGSGYFTVRIAKAVGPEGVVHALDASQEMLDHLAKRLRVENLGNVRPARIPRDDPGLPPEGVDTVLIVDMLHYVANRKDYALKLRQGLAPGGRVAIIDYRPKPWEDRPWGPPPEQQVPLEEIHAAMTAAGFALTESHEFLPEQYFAVFAAPGG